VGRPDPPSATPSPSRSSPPLLLPPFLPSRLPPPLAAPHERAEEAALFLDYDGTLAPIVDDPAGARPVPGVPELLARLGARLDVAAVVSGRPLAYLEGALGRPPGVRLAGLYGMEEVGPDGVLRCDPAAEGWRGSVQEATDALVRAAPPGVEVEPKGLAVTVHWRRAPEAEEWARAAAASAAARTGLRAQLGRMSVELRPPVAADKGTVVARLGARHAVVGCFGDDVGDIPAFEAVAALGRAGATTVTVVVADAEGPPELLEMADFSVAGPHAAVALLEVIVGS
jgi:trehalose 6-phosphate phosphatase